MARLHSEALWQTVRHTVSYEPSVLPLPNYNSVLNIPAKHTQLGAYSVH